MQQGAFIAVRSNIKALINISVGIGLAFCKLALASHARVIIADLKLGPDSENLVKEDDNVFFTKCDVTKWDKLDDLVVFSQEALGDGSDVYVANAGVSESVGGFFPCIDAVQTEASH